MLLEIHAALTRLMREMGKLPEFEVDILFEMPTREKVDSLIRPSLNFFLFDIEENTDLRQTGMETVHYPDNTALHRMPPRRFDLYFDLFEEKPS